MLSLVEGLERSWPKTASKRFENRKSLPKIIRGAYASADFVLKDEKVMREVANTNPDG